LEYNKFKPGDLIEKRVDNEFYYKQLKVNAEYGIVLETKIKDYGAYRDLETMTREWVKVLWVGNEPVSTWHVMSSNRFLKVEE
tara:strand:- start:43 stop:291 length:249 start_codon:yes stop_codon:yes gene_type:complete